MLFGILRFINREEERARLDRLARRRDGGLAVVYGRRRLGKTRLLLEWTRRHGGLYTVADQSTADIQRRYFAEAVSRRLAGFADVEYRDWRGLLDRLAREAADARWRGPLVFDELPYLVLGAPELPSVLQQWLDHGAFRARLVVALAGSSQRMMQGLVLAADAALYGRAREILELRPIDANYLPEAFGRLGPRELVETYAAWGGVPRYWELAAAERGPVPARVERLVLDPLGPLHREPDRILVEEVPSALEVRPVLDAIGAGAHRVAEIGGRLGRPATSLSRPLERLIGMDLVKREVPYGEPERTSRRSLYTIADPFFRLWFRVVAPHRGALVSGEPRARRLVLDRHWNGLVAAAWEDLVRRRVPRLRSGAPLARAGPWGPASRWWRGTLAEWDVVSASLDGQRLLLGEVKWSARPFALAALEREARVVAAKAGPLLSESHVRMDPIRALFVPEVERGAGRRADGVLVVTCSDLFP
jgi:AAA+ ATPase superfamily predicted ATPase